MNILHADSGQLNLHVIAEILGPCLSDSNITICRLSSQQGGQEQFGATHAMLTRFETVGQLQAFLRLPPCSQLLKTSEDPYFASALSFTYDIAPPSGARSTAPQKHLL